MCGRYSEAHKLQKLEERYGATLSGPKPVAIYHIAPTDAALALRQQAGKRSLKALQWGFFLPHQPGKPGINARSETAAASPLWGKALAERRCIVPADAYYEWPRLLHPSSDKVTRSKQPERIQYTDGRVISWAGLWQPATETDAPEGPDRFTILTSACDPAVLVHDRKPVFLTPDLEQVWLDPTAAPDEVLAEAEARFRYTDLKHFPVDPRLNATRHKLDDPILTKPYVPDQTSLF